MIDRSSVCTKHGGILNSFLSASSNYSSGRTCGVRRRQPPSQRSPCFCWAGRGTEEESAAVRLAMKDAIHCTWQTKEEKLVAHTSWWQEDLCGPLSEWMLAEASFDLFCQQIRGSSTVERFRACLPRLQRFLCSGHRTRPHLYTQVCRWLEIPAPVPQDGERAMIA